MNSSQKTPNSTSAFEVAGFVIPSRVVGFVIAGMVVLLFMAFMTGYFWGKKKALETFCRGTERESLADHINAALYGGFEYKEATTPSEIDEVVDEQESDVTSNETEHEGKSVSPSSVESKVEPEEISNQNIEQVTSGNPEQYHAELIGFGTLQGAKRFAARLEKKQIAVVINKRVSKTAKGRVVTWYQVVTPTFNNKDQLIELVNSIKQQERLNDVRILANMDRY